MRYEVELAYSYLRRWAIIEADSAPEAREKAEAWARTMIVPLDDCWVTVKSADGRFETFEPSEL
jgi:hypothetical protein